MDPDLSTSDMADEITVEIEDGEPETPYRYDVGPLVSATTQTPARIFIQFNWGAEMLIPASEAPIQALLSRGWQVHAPLFHSEDTTVVPRVWFGRELWEGVTVYNLNDPFARHRWPVADDPDAAVERFADAVLARDGARRLALLPLVDFYADGPGQAPAGARLRDAAEAILAPHSGVHLVIATGFRRPHWYKVDVELLAGAHGVRAR
ncbi:MAG: hypothetical protein WAV90_03715 [Gordonia amarae]